MELWMSGEIESDVFDAYRLARIPVEQSINQKLRDVELSEALRQWALIAIIRKTNFMDYGEISRRLRRDKSLEFRLKIDHKEFIGQSSKNRKLMIIETLRRSIDLMEKLSVAKEDRDKLRKVLDSAENDIRNTPDGH